MANKSTALTASNIKYMLALYSLCPENTGTRCVRLAEELGLSKPSVHTMIGTLIEIQIVRKDAYSTVSFTEEGLRLAKEYSRYYEMICSYLERVFSKTVDLHAAACALIAEIPQYELSAFCEKYKMVQNMK